MHQTRVAKPFFLNRLICCLVVYPLAAFVGSVSTVLFVDVLLAAFALYYELDRSQLRYDILRYVVPLSILIILLAASFQEGPLVDRLVSGGILSAKFISLIGFGILFSALTNPVEIPQEAMRLGIPHRFGIAFMVAYRMVPLLSKKYRTIRAAQVARGASRISGWRGIAVIPRAFLAFAVPAVLAALESSLIVSDTLFLRGYRPDRPITRPLPIRISFKSDIPLLMGAAVSILLILLNIEWTGSSLFQ